MDVTEILQSVGYLGIFLCVCIESGIIFGLLVPLPGFSLLFAAGVFAANDRLNIYLVLLSGLLGAVLGYIIGYITGKRYGRRLFYESRNKRYFTAAQGERTEKFMQKHGYITLFVGRFLPIVHTVAPILSGVAKTPIGPFMIINLLGAAVWVCSATFLGYFVGASLPGAQYYVVPFVVILVVILNTRFARDYIKRLLARIESL